MRAVQIVEFGGPDVLNVEEVEEPRPGPGDVLVEIRAAGVNFWDTEVRSGIGPPNAVRFPHVLGTDGAGIIRAVGEGVATSRIGESVVTYAELSCGYCDDCLGGYENRCENSRFIGIHAPGTYADFVVLPSQNAIAFSGIGFEEAARVGIPFTTAWHLLVERVHVAPGNSILVVGAGGEVGLAAVQIATLCGARVIAATSSEKKQRLATEAGAEVVLDYRSSDIWSEVRRLTGGKGVHFVIDNSGSATLMRSILSLRRGGSALVVGCVTGSTIPDFDVRSLYVRHLSVLGSSNGTRANLRAVLDHASRRILSVNAPEVMPIAEVRRAHDLVASGAKTTGIVLATAG